MGGEPIVFALHTNGLAEEEYVKGIRIRRFRLRTRAWPKRKPIQLIKYIEAIVRMIRMGLLMRPDLVHANDLSALPIGYLISRLVGAKLIYDSHELWADPSHRVQFPRWMFKVGLAIERYLARKAKSVITVSDSIAEHMASHMMIDRPIVIRNLPKKNSMIKSNSLGPLRKTLRIPKDVPILLYQGGISRGRGLKILIEAINLIKHPTAVLVFLGNGELVEELKKKVELLKLKNKVFFHSAVPPFELHKWTRDATIGIHPMRGSCLNHKYALPNKVFEYIQVALPILVTDLPEMKKIVELYGVGEVFPDGDAVALAKKIDKLLFNKDLLFKYRSAAIKAAKELNWESEKNKLISIYKKLI